MQHKLMVVVYILKNEYLENNIKLVNYLFLYVKLCIFLLHAYAIKIKLIFVSIIIIILNIALPASQMGYELKNTNKCYIKSRVTPEKYRRVTKKSLTYLTPGIREN